MNQEELSTKTLDELREIAGKLNIHPHHKAKSETIISQILQQPVALQRDAMEHVATTPVAPIHVNTPDMVNQAIAQFLKLENFKAEYPGDGTWWFKSFDKNGRVGAEECGNLSIPLRVIRQKAESVSKGRRVLKGLGRDNTYNDYADNILQG